MRLPALPCLAVLAMPASALAGALPGGGGPAATLRCTDFVTATFDAGFYRDGTCSVAGAPGVSGWDRGERACHVAGSEGGTLWLGPHLSFTWDETGPETTIDGTCRYR